MEQKKENNSTFCRCARNSRTDAHENCAFQKNKIKAPAPELLAPAGSYRSLEAAIEAGTDAVYFGAGDFNARMRAENFGENEIASALKLCSQYGVRSYITLNTRLRDRELESALYLAQKLYSMGADAFITADAGLCRKIKELIPNVELHASTQMSGHSSKDALALSELGFSRMVCPREMSFGDISALVKNSPIEIEMFIHGAHCVSFSGQCMMSFVMGGRSGNRGMCAQPCRLPFNMPLVKNKYPLSLKDMCLARSIEDVISTGVSSLKIEGRQKSADYVYGVTRIYRRLLDEGRSASDDEMQKLFELFSRSGFTDGYFKEKYKNMLGVRLETDRACRDASFSGLSRKIPLDAILTLSLGTPAELFVTDGRRSSHVVSDLCVTFTEQAEKALSYEAAKKNMSRLGTTAFTLGKFEFKTEKGAFLPLSAVNSMRREAVERLGSFGKPSPCGTDEKIIFPSLEKIKSDESTVCRTSRTNIKKRKILTAEFLNFSLVPSTAFDFFDKIYIPLGNFEKNAEEINRRGLKEKIFPFLPPVTLDRDEKNMKERLERLAPAEVLVNGLGQAVLAKRAGASPAGSFRFNVFNSEAAQTLGEFVDSLCISPEAPTGLLRDIKGVKSSVIVYGRLPLMYTRRCMISDGGAFCPFGGNGGGACRTANKKKGENKGAFCDGELCRSVLRDRTGANLPVVGFDDCTNIIYNSAPVYMGDKKDLLRGLCAYSLHFVFSTESASECEKVIDAYMNGDLPQDMKNIRRIK